MALANKLGNSYTAVKDKLKVKTIHIKFEENEFDLKVRIPLKQEFESINETIAGIDEAEIDKLYNKLSKPIKKSIEQGGDEFVNALNKDKDYLIIKDNDIIIDGTSIRNVALMSLMNEAKVEQYFHLLISETGEPITETFDEISQEFPDEMIQLIIKEIEKAIKPDYSSVKKN